LADYARAKTFEEQGLQVYRELKDRWGMCETLTWLGMALSRQGDYQQATAVLEESLKLARQAGDTNGIAFAVWQLGNNALAQGDYKQATAHLEESLALFKEIKQNQGEVWSISSLGKAALQNGDYPQAISRYKEALALYWERGHERNIAEGLEQLANALVVYKQPEPAARLLGAAEALRETSQASQYPYEVTDYKACLESLRLQLDEATL
jgi:tetratricopeptide (TPR) repeat protein